MTVYVWLLLHNAKVRISNALSQNTWYLRTLGQNPKLTDGPADGPNNSGFR